MLFVLEEKVKSSNFNDSICIKRPNLSYKEYVLFPLSSELLVKLSKLNWGSTGN